MDQQGYHHPHIRTWGREHLHVGTRHAIVVTRIRAGESRSEARGNISFEGPIGPEITSGGVAGPPLLYLGAQGK